MVPLLICLFVTSYRTPATTCPLLFHRDMNIFQRLRFYSDLNLCQKLFYAQVFFPNNTFNQSKEAKSAATKLWHNLHFYFQTLILFRSCPEIQTVCNSFNFFFLSLLFGVLLSIYLVSNLTPHPLQYQ